MPYLVWFIVPCTLIYLDPSSPTIVFTINSVCLSILATIERNLEPILSLSCVMLMAQISQTAQEYMINKWVVVLSVLPMGTFLFLSGGLKWSLCLSPIGLACYCCFTFKARGKWDVRIWSTLNDTCQHTANIKDSDSYWSEKDSNIIELINFKFSVENLLDFKILMKTLSMHVRKLLLPNHSQCYRKLRGKGLAFCYGAYFARKGAQCNRAQWKMEV